MRTNLKRFADAVRRAQRFAMHDIWQIGTPGEELPRGFIIKQIRVAILLGSKLLDGMHMVRAASLTFALERFADEASYAYREAVGLRAMVETGSRFSEGRPGFTAEVASAEWNVPLRLLNDVLDALARGGLLAVRLAEPPEYQPARPLDKIAAGDIVHVLRQDGTDPSRFLSDGRFRKLFDELGRTDRAFAGATLADLVEGYVQSLSAPAASRPSVNA